MCDFLFELEDTQKYMYVCSFCRLRAATTKTTNKQNKRIVIRPCCKPSWQCRFIDCKEVQGRVGRLVTHLAVCWLWPIHRHHLLRSSSSQQLRLTVISVRVPSSAQGIDAAAAHSVSMATELPTRAALERLTFGLVIVGAGPAGIAPLVAAARAHVLPHLLQGNDERHHGGVLLVDTRPMAQFGSCAMYSSLQFCFPGAVARRINRHTDTAATSVRSFRRSSSWFLFCLPR